MPNIVVQKVREAGSLPRQLLEEMESIAGKIRVRAYELFLKRGASPGREMEDWLQAERDLVEALRSLEVLDRDIGHGISVSEHVELLHRAGRPCWIDYRPFAEAMRVKCLSVIQ